MAEFRTSSGVVTTTPMMRTASGLVECAPQFRTTSGLIDCGSSKPLSAVAQPSEVSGARSVQSPSPIGTNSTTVTAGGGKPPYAFSWSTEAGWTVSNPSGATVSFSSTVNPGQQKDATFVCTVTDAKGNTTTASVDASVANYGGGNVSLQ